MRQERVGEFRRVRRRENGVAVCLEQVETVHAAFHVAGARHEEFVPEERLQGVKVEVSLFQETHLVIAGPYILLVEAVDQQHILRRKFHDAHLHSKEAERKANHVVALHAQCPVDRKFLAQSAQRHLHVGRDTRFGVTVALLNHLLYVGSGRCAL